MDRDRDRRFAAPNQLLPGLHRDVILHTTRGQRIYPVTKRALGSMTATPSRATPTVLAPLLETRIVEVLHLPIPMCPVVAQDREAAHLLLEKTGVAAPAVLEMIGIEVITEIGVGSG